MSVIANPCPNSEFSRFLIKDKSEHFHQLCLLPFDNGTKIENVFDTRGVLRTKFLPKIGYISLKIKVDLQLSYDYITVSYSCDLSAAISAFIYSLSTL